MKFGSRRRSCEIFNFFGFKPTKGKFRWLYLNLRNSIKQKQSLNMLLYSEQSNGNRISQLVPYALTNLVFTFYRKKNNIEWLKGKIKK